MATQSAAEQYRAVILNARELREKAIAETLGQIETLIADLNDWGFSYKLNNGEAEPQKKKITRPKNPDAPCKVCGFVTDPPHDSRSHRGQDVQKPFTAKELAEKGYTKRVLAAS